jgi:ABC-2 type transport system permease protein
VYRSDRLHHWLSCVVAIYTRDMQFTALRPLGVVMRTVNVMIGICGFYFLAKLIDPSHFMTYAHRPSGYFAYVSVNLAFLVLQTSALQSISAAIRSDQAIGALEPILATQRKAWPFIVSSGLWPLTISLIEVGISLLVAWLLGLNLGSTNGLTLVLFVTLSTLAMASIGLLSSAAVIAFQQVLPTTYLIAGAAPLLAGVFFPVSVLPRPLQVVSWLLPLTHSLAGLRAAFAGASISQSAGDAIWLACAVLVLLPVGLVLVELAVRRGRRNGTLSLY